MNRVTRPLILSILIVLVSSVGCLAAFSNIGAGIPALAGAVAWGDYDKDGDLDLAIAGADGTNTYARIYQRDSSGAFVDIGAPLPAVSGCALAWGDCDNDGDLDLAIAGAGTLSSVAQDLHKQRRDIHGEHFCVTLWGL